VGHGPLPPGGLALGAEGRGPGRAPGPACLPCCARAVPRAGVTAQARPGASGRAGTGMTTPGRAVPRAGPKPRAAGRASGPRATWPSISLVSP